MLRSAPTPFILDGAPAELSVLRNAGYCWGRINFPQESARPMDVTSEQDVYDLLDDEAAEVLIIASEDRLNLRPATSWL